MTIIILQQDSERIHPVVIQTRLKSIYIHIYTNNGNINTVPINVNLYSEWLPQSCRYKHTPSGNRNTKSVNTLTPCGYLRTVSSTVGVDASWKSWLFSQKFRLHAKIWLLNLLEPIRKTYFFPAENTVVMCRYNNVTMWESEGYLDLRVSCF